MSDQEPVGKRMLDQLRGHTEPYQPEAWEHFEHFRATKSRKKRIMFYWLSAAALLVIFGTALLTNQIIDRGTPTKHPAVQKQVTGGHPGLADTALPDNSVAPPLPELATDGQAVKSKKIQSKQENPTANLDCLQAAPRDQFIPDLLTSRPFNLPTVRFSKLHISLPQRQTQMPTQSARTIRWGVALSQQSNRAAHTNTELNYGLGGALLVPLSSKIALVTGILGSKQSLNVERPEQLTAAGGSAQLQRVRYHWVNLEVPLQIQYKFRTFRNLGFTATGGIALQSSVGQEANYHYKTRRTIATFAETAGGPVLVSTQTIEELSSITENSKKHTWAIGSPLYFGLGISYQWQNTAIAIEPYVKYPLGASTAERLQLTTVGIQLRLTGPVRKTLQRAGHFRSKPF